MIVEQTITAQRQGIASKHPASFAPADVRSGCALDDLLFGPSSGFHGRSRSLQGDFPDEWVSSREQEQS